MCLRGVAVQPRRDDEEAPASFPRFRENPEGKPREIRHKHGAGGRAARIPGDLY